MRSFKATMKAKLKRIYKYLAVAAVIFVLDRFGVFTHLFELEYDTHFQYPMEGDVLKYAQARKNKQSHIEDGSEEVPNPINLYNYTFLHERQCDVVEAKKPQLTLLIKSALGNVQRRDAIRRTWGYEQRPDVHIRRVFLMGTSSNTFLMDAIDHEAREFGDVVQADFIDSYFNNTIKTMMGFKWVVERCPRAHYYMFVDDDYYVSMKNVLRFIAHPALYPENAISLNSMWEKKASNEHEKLYGGFVFQTRPLRQKFSKWLVTLKEYPFNRWPPYVTAGAFILSRSALTDLYYVSQYTKHFRFDDIYLGFVALKARINLTHCGNFHFYRPRYSGPDSYRFVVASHEFADTSEMERIWNECRSSNYA
ncbi:beta-1,3-galactosyltransferase brn [Stomoxys calcitrans]|uniref:beta-1,3-galactosyltransferase brn n=1 Tax=Stomoxys calcitrans TaxID=35570 RepID=UPI0027E32E0B|nr:beta-1,3-galactosyltransferase brn [Stomoxys calcitrans]